jgi:RNA polymerase sigma factor (sigma-70 family)
MDDRHKPPRGDEARLFEQFNDELMRTVGRNVQTSPEIVEDACSLAWAQFLAHQPDRSRHWKGWLFRTAQREAWRLDRQRYETLGIAPGETRPEPGVTWERADPKDRHDERLGLNAAVEVLEQLPPRLRRIAFLRAAGLRYREIGELTGDSERRVNQLVANANLRIYEVLGRMRDADRDLPPRAQRLRQLENAPPRWVTAEIGRPPRSSNRRVSSANRLLAWRRAALAIDDYRAVTRFDATGGGLGERPSDADQRRAFDHARRAIDGFNASRAKAQARELS